MTRGRKKDHTIPQSRSLAQQRDYRARKAQYVANLEKRCQTAEDENRRLRRELERARIDKLSNASVYNPEAAQALSTLLQQLSAASSTLGRFQQLAFPNQQQHHESPITPVSDSTSFPSSSTFVSKHAYNREQADHGLLDTPTTTGEEGADTTSFSRARSRSPSLGSNCCDGWMNCRGLVERDDGLDSVREGEDGHRHVVYAKTSDIRSTYEGR